MAMAKQHPGCFAIDLPRLGIDLKSDPNLLLGLFGAAFLLEVPGLDAMSLGKRRIEFDCPLRGWKCVFVLAEGKSDFRLGERHEGPRLRVIRIQLRRLLAKANNGLIPSRIPEVAADPLLTGH